MPEENTVDGEYYQLPIFQERLETSGVSLVKMFLSAYWQLIPCLGMCKPASKHSLHG